MALKGASGEPVDLETSRMYREYRYRKTYSGLTHEQYLDEPRTMIDWTLAFAGMEAEMEREEIEKARRQSS